MPEYDNRVLRGQTATAAAIDQGLRAYMLRVYNYMAVGLAITGVVAYAVSMLTMTSDPATAATPMYHGLALTSLGKTLYLTPLRYVVMLAPLAMVLLINVRRMSLGGMQMAFWIFSALMGLSLSVVLFVYTGNSIFQMFLITAAAFGGLSLWGYTTGRDLTGMGSFLFMGLFGIVIASVVNLFFYSSMTSFVISAIGIVVFSGLTAYDTQKIKESYFTTGDAALMGRNAIAGALELYLDFINLFISLLRIFGDRR